MADTVDECVQRILSFLCFHDLNTLSLVSHSLHSAVKQAFSRVQTFTLSNSHLMFLLREECFSSMLRALSNVSSLQFPEYFPKQTLSEYSVKRLCKEISGLKKLKELSLPMGLVHSIEIFSYPKICQSLTSLSFMRYMVGEGEVLQNLVDKIPLCTNLKTLVIYGPITSLSISSKLTSLSLNALSYDDDSESNKKDGKTKKKDGKLVFKNVDFSCLKSLNLSCKNLEETMMESFLGSDQLQELTLSHVTIPNTFLQLHFVNLKKISLLENILADQDSLIKFVARHLSQLFYLHLVEINDNLVTTFVENLAIRQEIYLKELEEKKEQEKEKEIQNDQIEKNKNNNKKENNNNQKGEENKNKNLQKDGLTTKIGSEKENNKGNENGSQKEEIKNGEQVKKSFKYQIKHLKIGSGNQKAQPSTLSDNGLEQLLNLFSKVNSLVLYDLTEVTKLPTNLVLFRTLKKLQLEQMYFLGPFDLSKIISSCQQLQTVEVTSHDDSFEQQGKLFLESKSLETLIVPVEIANSIVIKSCPKLIRVRVSQNDGISSVRYVEMRGPCAKLNQVDVSGVRTTKQFWEKTLPCWLKYGPKVLQLGVQTASENLLRLLRKNKFGYFFFWNCQEEEVSAFYSFTVKSLQKNSFDYPKKKLRPIQTVRKIFRLRDADEDEGDYDEEEDETESQFVETNIPEFFILYYTLKEESSEDQTKSIFAALTKLVAFNKVLIVNGEDYSQHCPFIIRKKRRKNK